MPAPTEKRKAVSGAIRVICFGRLSMILAATSTIQSIPPAACIMAAAVTTARMMAMAPPGGSPGASWKMKTSTNTPRPPHRPTPMPLTRVPIRMHTRTTSASSTNLTASMPGPSSPGCGAWSLPTAGSASRDEPDCGVDASGGD